jgi:hypothetical protein
MKSFLLKFGSIGTSAATIALLSACGGGGGGGSPVASTTPAPLVAAPEPAPQPDPEPTPIADSSRLADNPLPASASFDNFASAAVVVPVQDAGLTGERLFVKVSRPDGQTLFLGAVAKQGDFSLPVHVPLTDGKVLYEIFSDSASDQIVFGEVSL